MNITDVRVRLYSSNKTNAATRLRGVASITIENCFAVHGVKIIEKEPGVLIIGMPSRPVGDNEYKDVAHPINQETRTMLTEVVLAAYEKAVAESAGAVEEKE